MAKKYLDDTGLGHFWDKTAYKYGIEYIVGTQASATNVWTGVTLDKNCASSTIPTGKVIVYHLPYAGTSSAATLNLTFPDGTTSGAKNVYRLASSTIGTNFGAGCDLFMVFNGTEWKVSAYQDTDSNNYDRIRHNTNVKAASAVTAGQIIVGTDAGYKPVANGVTFSINYPILYAGSAINSGATNNNTYDAYPGVNLQSTKSGYTGTTYKMVFLVGTLSGTTFTVNSDIFAQTVPSSADSKVYAPIGLMTDSNKTVFFFPTNNYWEFRNGAFRPISTCPTLATVATSGSYNDLSNKPTIPTVNNATLTITQNGTSVGTFTANASSNKTIAVTDTTYSDATTSASGLMSASDKTKLNGIATGAEVNVQSDWAQTTTTADDYIKNKPSLATVATSGSYNDLSNKPTIPTVNNATLTIQKNGSTVKTFTANASSNVTANITVPTKTSDLTNDSNFATTTDLAAKVNVASINLTGQTTTILAQVQALAGTKNYARFICTSDGGSANISDNPNAGKGFVCVAYQSRGSSSSDYAYEVICYSNDGASKPYYARVIHSTTSITWKRLQDVAFSGSYNDLSNKPTIPAAQVNSDWNATSGKAQILNKPTLAAVATSGSYNDLSNKPTIPAAQVQSNWTQTTTTAVDYIKNKPTLATVATSGNYNDLSNKPTIPTVNNATLTIQKNGSTVKTFTANASSNVTANITVPTKTSDITNDSDFTTNAIAQKFATQDSMAAPDFDGMTPLQTFTWSVSDTTYRAVYQMDNTGWAYDNMDVAVAYRITVTGTSISQVVDVYERWYSPTNYPVTSAMCRTLSTSAATTGFRYLRAVYPTSSGLNNNTYKIGSEISNYNTTARTIKVEVFKTATGVTWNATKPSGSIYTSSTYQANNAVQTYSTRGWIFRKAASFQANGADVASFVNSYEPWSMSSSTLKAGAALTNGYLAYLATDGKVYMVTNTTQNMVPTDAGKIGLVTTGYNADATIDYRYFRPLAAMSSTQVGYISHDTFTLGYPVYLRCTMDSSGNIHSGNYLTTSMAAGYTYVPIGVATATNTVALDARKPMFYTLDSSGKLSHVNGKAVAGTTYTAGAHINITGNTIKAIDYVHSDTPVSTSSVTPIVTNSMISDGTITFSKTATGEFLKLTLTTTDPGAGSALAANTLLGVYE